MNRLIRSNLKLSLIFDQNNIQKLIYRSFTNTKPALAGFAKDFKPGPYPKTEAERVAAAKKYGLKPEDYEPMPDDGFGFGDYPNLGRISTDMKSDWNEYDDPYLKRNFGEPIQILQEQITADKVTLRHQVVSFPKIFFWFLFGSALFFGLNLYFLDYKLGVPVAAKQYPRNADTEKHYKI